MIKRPANEHGYVFLIIILLLVVLMMVVPFFVFRATPVLVPAGPPLTAPSVLVTTDNSEPGMVQVYTPDTAWMGYIGDALSRPIPGALVSSGTTDDPGYRSAFSDDHGKFVLLLPPDEHPLVTIQADGYYQTVVELDEGETNTYRLFRGGVLAGQVRGHVFILKGEDPVEPKPIPLASLEVAGVNGWYAAISADEEGRYSVVVPPGKIVVTARSQSHADARFDDLQLARDEVLERDFILAAGVFLDGFVLGEEFPAEGARVRLFNEIKDGADVIAGEMGKFKIEGLGSGFAKVHVVHQGFQENLWEIIIPNDRMGIRRPFALLKAQPFELTVLDQHQQPAPDARIRIRRSGITIVDTVASDQEGLNVLASAKTYQIEARLHRMVNGAPVSLPARIFRYTMPEQGPGELTIQLRPGGRITGLVVAPNGAPVPGASVLVRERDVPPDEASPPRLLKTNRSGAFRSEPFAIGKWGLTISHPQLGVVMVETTIEEGKTTSLGQLKLASP
ncbi:MAG: carboxypeptidase-like regulatory domain-containing protein [Planctomycetota bacterium]|nr:carboxypeptidase-like regulatory domain-containing protein [Planctomycetota bacterium]